MRSASRPAPPCCGSSGCGSAATGRSRWRTPGCPPRRFPGLLERDLGGSLYALMRDAYGLGPVERRRSGSSRSPRAPIEAEALEVAPRVAADARRAHRLRRRRHAGRVRPRPPPRRPRAVRHPRRPRRPARPCALSCATRSRAGAGAGRRRGRARGARRRHHEPQLPPPPRRPRRRRAAARQGHRAARDRPRGRARRDRRGGRGPASGPRCVALPASRRRASSPRFIHGRPVTAEAAARARALAEVAAALRAVHAGPPLPVALRRVRGRRRLPATARAGGAAVPRAYDDADGGRAAIRAALDGPEHAPVPCHNDLLTANFIHDGARVRIVDWEYAGMGDRYFDLGNLVGQQRLRRGRRRAAARGVLRRGRARRAGSPRCG